MSGAGKTFRSWIGQVVRKQLQDSALANGAFSRFVPQNRRLTIGITTYCCRYTDYFLPLMQSLARAFHDYPLIVNVNAYPDKEKQQHYLTELETRFKSNASQVRFIVHQTPVGVSRLWNELIESAETEQILLLNDDVSLFPPLRGALLRLHDGGGQVFNNMFSHFVVSRSLVDTVGWFDERFAGFGSEDIDFALRCAAQSITLQIRYTPWLVHDWRPYAEEHTTYDAISHREPGGTKYSDMNHNLFLEKWRRVASPGGALFCPLDRQYYLPNVPSAAELHERRIAGKDANMLYYA